MTNFNSRWQKLVHCALGNPPPAANEFAPFGFATRVAALREKAAQNYHHSILALWHRLTLRALGVALLLVILGVMLEATGNDDDSLSPPIADSMAEAFWLQ